MGTEAWIAGEAASARSAVSFEHGKLVWMMLRTLLVIDLRDTGAEATGAVKKLHGETALESLADVAPTLILSRSDVRKDCVAKSVATKEYAMRVGKRPSASALSGTVWMEPAIMAESP